MHQTIKGGGNACLEDFQKNTSDLGKRSLLRSVEKGEVGTRSREIFWASGMGFPKIQCLPIYKSSSSSMIYL